MLWKWTKRIGLGLIGSLALLIVTGALYQNISTKLDESKYPPLGKMVDIGGYRLHINFTGEGGPTVVADSGLGCNSLDLALVQSKINSGFCSYDRAGYGWSDPSPLPRTSENIVEELHTLLTNANIPKPYILVGHSFGGANVRLYASRYPDEVAGVILVDSAHEDQIRKLPATANKVDAQMNDSLLYLAHLGVIRLAQNLSQYKAAIEMFPKDMQGMYSSKKATAQFMATVLNEWANLGKSLDQLKSAAGNLGEKPLIVITAGKTVTTEESGLSQEDIDILTKFNQDLQKDLVSKSTKGKQIIAENSNHMIPHQQPQIIIDSIQEMVKTFSF